MTVSLAAAMAVFSPALPLAVAFSGGADSTALLLACAEKWPGQVIAIHIHHGLQAAADQFELHCSKLCSQLDVPLLVKMIDARHSPGQSPEEAARRGRYKALEAVILHENTALAIKSIAIAQHADDQVETILLALSRGGGLPGLSAMPAAWTRSGLGYFRPFLKVRSSEVRLWLAERGVEFVEDPTNADENFTRNRIRARLMPALELAMPQFRDTFARSAAHAVQAQVVLDEVAQQDLALIGSPPIITQIQGLSRPRQANLLRYWMRTVYSAVSSAAQMKELLDQIAACTTRGHQIRIKVGLGFVERRGKNLHWYNGRVLL